MDRIKVFEVGIGDVRETEDKRGIGEMLEERVNAWLVEHPDITVSEMYQTALSHDQYVAIILTIYYTEPSE